MEMPFDFHLFKTFFAADGFLSPPKLKPNLPGSSYSVLKTFNSWPKHKNNTFHCTVNILEAFSNSISLGIKLFDGKTLGLVSILEA